MQGALLDALPLCGSDPVLIVGNDIVEPELFSQIRTQLQRGDADGIIAARKVDEYFPGGYLTVNETSNRDVSTTQGHIVNIVEKPGKGNEPSNLVNLVIHAHKNAADLLSVLQHTQSHNDDAYEQALTTLFQQKNYQAFFYNGTWFPLKFPWHLLSVLSHILQQKNLHLHPSAIIHPTAIIDGNVVLGEDVHIHPYACIRGPCVIGDRSSIGNNALIRATSIGTDCVIGYNSEIKNSVLSDHVWTHSTYIAESIIGRNVSFGAGSVTANLRLDEAEIFSQVKDQHISTGLYKLGTIIGDDVRIGIQVGLQPGIKIGSGTFINSRTLVTKDIPAKSFVQEKGGEISIKENRSSLPQQELREGFRAEFMQKTRISE